MSEKNKALSGFFKKKKKKKGKKKSKKIKVQDLTENVDENQANNEDFNDTSSSMIALETYVPPLHSRHDSQTIKRKHTQRFERGDVDKTSRASTASDIEQSRDFGSRGGKFRKGNYAGYA